MGLVYTHLEKLSLRCIDAGGIQRVLPALVDLSVFTALRPPNLCISGWDEMATKLTSAALGIEELVIFCRSDDQESVAAMIFLPSIRLYLRVARGELILQRQLKSLLKAQTSVTHVNHGRRIRRD